jgi:hypothetical protein
VVVSTPPAPHPEPPPARPPPAGGELASAAAPSAAPDAVATTQLFAGDPAARPGPAPGGGDGAGAPTADADEPSVIAPHVLQGLASEHRVAIEGCIAHDPSVAGKLIVEIVARADGTVASARARSGGSGVVRRCVAALVQRWRIPAPGREVEGTMYVDLD